MKNCIVCNKEYKKRSGRENPYCSRECFHNAMKGLRVSPKTEFKVGDKKPNGACIFPVGEQNPNWHGGVDRTWRQKIMATTEYKNWRVSVFQRDDYICQLCGQRGRHLHADHIKRFADYPELRLELSNGRTLCEDCHKTTDTYGYKGVNL